MRIRRCVGCLVLGLGSGPAVAQQITFNNSRQADVIAQRVEAQSKLIDAQGEAWKNMQQGNLYYAKAREKLAEAVDKELDNWLKQVRVYYERREERERGKMALLDVYMERTAQTIKMREERDRRVLQTQDTDQKRTGVAVENGTALNRYLDALYDTPISYGIELSTSMKESLSNRMDLDANTLHHLRVRGRNRGGTELVFRLGDNAGMDLDWWPSGLREHVFDADRLRVELARERVVELSKKNERMIEIDAIDELEAAVGELSRSFFKKYPPNDRKGFRSSDFEKVHRAEDFLARIDRDVRHIRDAGHGRALGDIQFDPATDGRDLPTLATWMLRNGLQFEASTPGDEAAYRQVFTMLRELQALMNE